MADKGGGTSMSALGSFYDALYELAEKQQRVYGDAGVPDVVPYQVNDQIADGIVAVAASMTGSNAVGGIVENQITKPMYKAFGQGVGPTIELVHPTVAGGPAGNQTFTVDGESYGFQEIGPGGVAVNPGNASKALIDPAGLANSLADAYWQNLLLARQVDMVSDFFGDPVEKVAANYVADRRSGVDSDIAATIAIANEGAVQSSRKGVVRTDLEFGGKAPGEVSAVFDKQAEDAWKAMNASISGTTPAGQPKAEEYDKYVADYMKDKADKKQTITKKDYWEFVDYYKAAAEKNRASGALDVAVAMCVGIDNQAERDEFIKFYNAKLKKEIADEYNLTVAGSTNNQIKKFTDIFDENNLGVKLSDRNPLSLFDPAMGGRAPGDNIQRAYANVLGRHAVDPSLSPSLQRNLQNFYDVSQNQHRFGVMVTGMSMGIDPKKNNIKYLVNTGVESLKNDWGGLDKKRDAKYARMEDSLNKRFNSSAQTLANQAGYIYYRWNTMPAINKIFTPLGLLTGTSWLQMSTWAGGLTGPMSGRAVVADKLGIRALHTSGVADKLAGMTKKTELMRSRVASDLAAFGATDKRVIQGQKNLSKMESQLKRYQGKAKKYENYTSSAIPSPGATTKSMMNWKMVDVISHKANPFQKTAYFMYAFSPGAFFGGLLNGDTFQRMAWIGSGFGKNIKWKYVRNADGKGYSKVIDTSGFSRLGKFAYNRLNSSGYQSVARAARRVGFIINAPANLTNAVIARFQKSMRDAAKLAARKVAAQLAKTAIGKALVAAAAYITAGVSEFLRYAYMIGNFVTFGALDKITGALLRITFQLVVGLIIGIVALTILGFQNLAEVGGPQYLSQNVGNGGLFAPDPGYNPVLAVGDPYGNVLPPGTKPPPLPPIDWTDYDDFSDNACPVQTTDGASVTYCSQGPNGTYSHHGTTCPSGNPCNYAIDLAPGDRATQVVAPEDGKVYYRGISCKGGTVVGVKFDGVSGTSYVFYHVIKKDSIPDGSSVTKGTVIGAMIIGPSLCSSGSHVHMEVWKGGSLDPRPDAAYSVMCNLSPPLACK